MKNLFFVLSILTVFIACTRNDISSTQTPLKENVSSNISLKENTNKAQSNFSFEELISAQSSSKEIPKWVAPNYKDLQLGKATNADVIKMFGKPDYEGNPDDEYDSPDKSRIFYSYEKTDSFYERIQFIMDARSKILLEVWLNSNYQKPLMLEKAIEMFGDDFFELKFQKGRCLFKRFRKTENREYPFYIAYPQKGIQLFVTDQNEVGTIYYLAKC